MTLLTVLLALAQFDRPVAEVHSGAPLNAWLERLDGRTAPAAAEPEPALQRKTVEAINLSFTGKGGVLPLRKPDVAWPAALTEGAVEKARERWAGLMRKAEAEARKGGVSEAARGELAALRKRLEDDLVTRADDLTITQYIEGKRFLNRLRDDLEVLKSPDAGRLLGWADDLTSARRSVPGLVKWMREKKLRFAACLPGQEKEYEALHRAMADFDRRSATKK